MNVVVTDSRHDRVELYHISHQSGQGGGRRISTDASCMSHGGGGTDFRDRLIVVGGSWSKINAVKQLQSALLKTELHTKMPNSCEPVSF